MSLVLNNWAQILVVSAKLLLEEIWHVAHAYYVVRQGFSQNSIGVLYFTQNCPNCKMEWKNPKSQMKYITKPYYSAMK